MCGAVRAHFHVIKAKNQSLNLENYCRKKSHNRLIENILAQSLSLSINYRYGKRAIVSDDDEASMMTDEPRTSVQHTGLIAPTWLDKPVPSVRHDERAESRSKHSDEAPATARA
jgi:hypothetical protein